MQTNWLVIALCAFVVYGSIFGYFVTRRKWTKAGLGVGIANMFFVVLNLAAPFRGAFDPNYLGYNLGLIHVVPGILVTLVSGSIVVACLVCACLAVLNLKGRPMLFVATVDSILLILIGIPEIISGFANHTAYKIQLGEYLTIPGVVAVLLILLAFTIPLAASVLWSARRIRAYDTTDE